MPSPSKTLQYHITLCAHKSYVYCRQAHLTGAFKNHVDLVLCVIGFDQSISHILSISEGDNKLSKYNQSIQSQDHPGRQLIKSIDWGRYRNQSIDLLRKSMDWFLYDNGITKEFIKITFAADMELSNYPVNFNIYLNSYETETAIFIATKHEKTIMTVI